jgi:hypothetical protein
MKRVKQRDFTRTLNPGWVPRGINESTSGPWEIHVLCHHSRLAVLVKEEATEHDWRMRERTESHADGYRKNICTFLNAEGILIPCWERAQAKSRRSWLRSEATSVVATTLIEILRKSMEPGRSAFSAFTSAGQDLSSTEDSSLAYPLADVSGVKSKAPSIEEHLASLSSLWQGHSKRVLLGQKRQLQESLHMGGVIEDQRQTFERFTNESGLQPPILWESFRPPYIYHPASFFNSLEDTPDLYKFRVLSKHTVPLSLHNSVLDRPDIIAKKRQDFERSDIIDIMDDYKIRSLLFVFDIAATRKGENGQGFTWEIKDYQYGSNARTPEQIKHSKQRLGWAL